MSTHTSSFRSLALASLCLPMTAPWVSAHVAESVAPPTGAQVASTSTATPAATPSAKSSTVDDTSVEKRRVLTLASGQTIRVASRVVDGKWEYKGKSGWKTLESGAVTSAQLETELLAAWHAKRNALDSRKVDERAQLAAWAARSGLTVEALTELEAVLAQAPDQAVALETLRANWFFTVPTLPRSRGGDGDATTGTDTGAARVALTAAEDELLRFGAAQTACGRELAALELMRHPDKPALQKRLADELGSNVVTRRAFAALAMRRVFPGAEPKSMMVHAVLDASAEVRKSCALALKSADEPALCVPIVRALSSKSGAVRVNAAEALGVMGYTAAVEPLVARLAAAAAAPSGGDSNRLPHANIFVGRQVAYVQDFDVEVAQFQAVADPQINVYLEGSTMDAAVSGVLEMSFATESAAIGGALAKLTGEKPMNNAKAWLAWWDKNGPQWRAEDRSRPKTGAAN